MSAHKATTLYIKKDNKKDATVRTWILKAFEVYSLFYGLEQVEKLAVIYAS